MIKIEFMDVVKKIDDMGVALTLTMERNGEEVDLLCVPVSIEDRLFVYVERGTSAEFVECVKGVWDLIPEEDRKLLREHWHRCYLAQNSLFGEPKPLIRLADSDAPVDLTRWRPACESDVFGSQMTFRAELFENFPIEAVEEAIALEFAQAFWVAEDPYRASYPALAQEQAETIAERWGLSHGILDDCILDPDFAKNNCCC